MDRRAEALILGGTGFVGSHLVPKLLENNYRVTVVSRASLPRDREQLMLFSSYNAQIVTCELSEYFDSVSFDVIVNLAGKVAGGGYQRKKPLTMFQTNIEASTQGVRIAASAKPKLYLFASSAAVYPASHPVPHVESGALNGWPEYGPGGYGVAKLVGEFQTRWLYQEHGVKSCSLRFYNLYGPGDVYDRPGGHVVPVFVQRAVAGKSLQVAGDGTALRCFVDVRDAVEVIVRMARMDTDQLHGQAVNVGHSRPVTIMDLARQVCRAAGASSDLIQGAKGWPDTSQRHPDVVRLRSLLNGWEPDIPPEITLRDQVEDYRKRKTKGLARCAT
jgi:nucleoside-diphosphate-sugar epimerase